MTPNKAEKDFDCVEFKRQAQARIYEIIKDMTPEEEIEYFRKAVDEGPLGAWWRSMEEHKRRQQQEVAKAS